jgi:hypothetical protein
MVVWYKVKWIDPLFAAFNARWPNRNHAQDGTIGDLAHMQGVSGHNPDDTPGVQAERQDADTKPEVRAADVDARGVDMEWAVQAVLHGPAAELDRLIYIIFNRRIWRKANGWRQETYTGTDPHDTHAHFSGDPASDEDARPWTSLVGDDMTPEEHGWLADIVSRVGWIDRRIEADANGSETYKDPGNVTRTMASVVERHQLLARPVATPIDVQALAAALAPLLADALPTDISAAAVLDVLQSDAGQAALVRAANTAEDA